MTTTEPLLPDASDAGLVRRWYLPVTDANRRTQPPDHVELYARFLGMGTSHVATHSRHDDDFVPRSVRCNACRWFEARIFRELVLPDGATALDDVADPGDVRLGSYVVHSVGGTVVPGEVPLFRFEEAASPYSVIELMTTRRLTDRGPEAYLAKPSAAALAAAAGFDPQLADAYVNRAVS